jgi:hypothetical protein
MKKSVEKILQNLVKKSPAIKEVDSIDLLFLFRAPTKTAMCDWVYGIQINTLKNEINQPEVASVITQTVSKTLSNISKDTFCATDVKFESVF